MKINYMYLSISVQPLGDLNNQTRNATITTMGITKNINVYIKKNINTPFDLHNSKISKCYIKNERI